MSGPGIDLDRYEQGVRESDRTWLGRAITLVESRRRDHAEAAQELLIRLADPDREPAHRVGLSGVPGAGKSTFIDEFGTRLTGAGHRVAVLAVDPSSVRTGGSILGDKTRMARLATDLGAFIRPSPSAGVLGGVGRATRESIAVVEAAGFDVVIVETVGVGQSETTVANLVDTFVLLTLARSGDSLQGIKKGVLELADIIVVNKADGDRVTEARSAGRELASALHLVGQADEDWTPPVLTASGMTGDGVDEVWAQITAHRDVMVASGRFAARRDEQAIGWMWSAVESRLLERFRTDPDVVALADELQAELRRQETTPTAAAERLLAAASRRSGSDPRVRSVADGESP